MQPIATGVNATTPASQVNSTDVRAAPVVTRTADTAAPAVAVSAGAAVPDESQLKRAVDSANAAIKDISSDLEFTADPSSGKTVVRVIDRSTKQVIRQIPSEEMLTIARAIERVQGILIRHKA